MGDLAFDTAIDPDTWIVIFRPWSDSWLVRMVPGRFKHVSACAYLTSLKAWVTFDVGFDQTKLLILPDGRECNAVLARWIDGCTLVRMRKLASPDCAPAVFGWCVPSVARLIGLRSGALRPDALYRQCLRNGGTVLAHHDHTRAATSC